MNIRLLYLSISGSSFDLLSKECRKDWEKQFSESYIHRLRTDMPFKLKAAQDLIVSDNRQGTGDATLENSSTRTELICIP